MSRGVCFSLFEIHRWRLFVVVFYISLDVKGRRISTLDGGYSASQSKVCTFNLFAWLVLDPLLGPSIVGYNQNALTSSWANDSADSLV